MQKIRKSLIATILTISSIITVSSCNRVSDEEATKLMSILVPDTPDYSAYVQLGTYTGFECKTDLSFDVTDEDITNAINDTFYTLAEKTEVDRAAQENDLVLISYIGRIDGEEFEGGTTDEEGDSLIIGRHKYPQEFEEALIGMKKDDVKNITVTFNKDYNTENLRGKTATFETKMLTVVEAKTIDITDEVIQTYTTYANLNEMEAAMRDALTEQADQQRKATLYNAAMDSIIENATYNGYPEDVMNMLVKDAVDAVTSTALSNGMEVNDFLSENYGINSIDAYKATMSKQAEEHMQLRMTLMEIARKENITVTSEEFTEYKKNFADENGFDDIKCVNLYYSDQEILIDCLAPKVKDWILLNSISLA